VNERANATALMLALTAFAASTTAGRDANAQEPAAPKASEESPGSEAVSLGFDPAVARAAQVAGEAEQGYLQVEGGELGLRPRKDGSALYVDPHRRFTAVFHVDGTVQFADPWRRPSFNSERGVCCGPPLSLGTSGQIAGPAEWLMYMSDQEPLRREKAELLERSREFRTRLAVAFARKNMAEALGRLESELYDIWADSKLDETGRRNLLFARWDECDELFAQSAGRVPLEAISQIDAERVENADKARREIEAFIRRVAPEGSPKAYRSAELKKLNAGRISTQAFEPYQLHKWQNPSPPQAKATPAKATASPTPQEPPASTPSKKR
jgi:hypothetical protein